MLKFILLILIGLLVGTFVISTGGGGGSIYLGVLTTIFGLAPAAAAATSIVTALPALAIGSWLYYRQGQINFHLGNTMLVSAIPAVIIGSLLAPYIPTKIYSLIALSGLMVGIAGLSGGGPIMAGLLMMGATMINASATSSYVLICMSIVGTLLHLTGGHIDWSAGIGLMIGATTGAALAPRLMKKFATGRGEIILKIVTGALLVLLGVKTLY